MPEIQSQVLDGDTVLLEYALGDPRSFVWVVSSDKVASVTLTRREWEVLDLVRDGLTTGEIAERLFVTPETVRTHIAAAMRKLEVPDREAALRLLEPR